MQCEETISHLLVFCEEVVKIWLCLFRLIDYFCDIQLEINEENILLNNYPGPRKHLVNTLIVICKQYIYATKCLGENLVFDKCMAKVGDWYNVEKYLSTNVKKLTQKWSPIFWISCNYG